MTQQMREALEKRNHIWGRINAEVLHNIRREVKSPRIAFSQWLKLRGLKNMGYGYYVQIAGAE